MTRTAMRSDPPQSQSRLLPRQALFCARVVGGANATEAARAAGYAPRAAAQQASRLLRDPAIKAEIARLYSTEQTRRKLALDRVLAKADQVYQLALRERQCAAAIRAITLEAALIDNGANARSSAVDVTALEQELLAHNDTGPDERDCALPAIAEPQSILPSQRRRD